MLKKLSMYIVVLTISQLITACGTVSVSNNLIEKPANTATKINVVYVESNFNESLQCQSCSTPATYLHMLGYFDVNEKIRNLAPALLANRGVSANVLTMSEKDFRNGVAANSFKSSGLDTALILTFTDGRVSSYGGVGAFMNLSSIYKSSTTNQIYWNGKYTIHVKNTPFINVNFDDKFVSEMLQRIFTDMENNGLLPPKR